MGSAGAEAGSGAGTDARCESGQLQSERTGGCLGIIAGGGLVPVKVAESALGPNGQYESVYIVGLDGFAHEEVSRFPGATVGIGQVGRIIRLLRDHQCRDLVLVGYLRRPRLLSLRPDSGTLRNLPRLLALLKGGDDSVLSRVGRFMEEQGFRVLGAHEVAPQLAAPQGSFASASLIERDFEDMRIGARLIRALSPFDVGQAAIVSRGYVLAVEAAEGTDAMLTRCRDLHPWGLHGRSGVLVKAPKQGQDLRLDMPAIGPRTVELAVEAKLRGIAVLAGHILLADHQHLVEKADEAGLFLYGFKNEDIETSGTEGERRSGRAS
jgi:DUF1009 family protein